MNKPYSTVRLLLATSLLLPAVAELAAGDARTDVLVSTDIDVMPSWSGEPMLLAGTGMRGRSTRSSSGSSFWPFKRSLPKEDGEQFVDPEFKDVVGPAGQAGAATSSAPATTASKTKASSAPKQQATPPKATTTNQATAATPKQQAAPAPKPVTTPVEEPKPSVEALLREMYARDGREMPDIEYQPVPADNPAVRAARVKRGLSAVPKKKQPSNEVPVSDLELALDGIDGTVRPSDDLERSDFFPADETQPSTRTQVAASQNEMVFFPENAPQAAPVQAAPKPEQEMVFFPADEPQESVGTDTIPTKRVPEVFGLTPVNEPIVSSNAPGAVRMKSVGGLEIPIVDVDLPTYPSHRPQVAARPVATTPTALPPMPGEEFVAPQPQMRASENRAATPSSTELAAHGWRPASRGNAEPSEPVAAEGWAPTGERTASRDPLADAFIDGEEMIASNESLDITPGALDVTEETPNPLEPLTHRENLTGLKGFCPVTLCEHRDLIDADPRFSAVYQDRTYYVSSYEALKLFQEHPEKYAPVEGGRDVVRAARDQNDVEGILDHAAWYRGRLYLFETAQTLAVFSADPKTYSVD